MAWVDRLSSGAPLPQHPMLLVLDEKHESIFFRIESKSDLYAAALAVLRAREAAGYWYSDMDAGEKAEVSRALEESNGVGAWSILWRRRDADYEGVRLEDYAKPQTYGA